MPSTEFSKFAADINRQLKNVSLQDQRVIAGKLKRLSQGERELTDELRNSLILELATALEAQKHRIENLPKLSYDESLPVSAHHDEIVRAVREHQVVIIAGETGSGKTTQLPKMCLEAGAGIRGKIGHTQPRRIAARAVAARIADELNENLGKSVGYKVRFTDVTSPDSYIKIMTDGILLSETAHDRLLLDYDCIIIDEAHERSLNIDFLLGYLKNLLKKRPDLKLVITSATIDVERFSSHFNNAPIIEVSGRTYPVETVYMPPEEAQEDDEDEVSAADLKSGVLKAFKYLMHEYGRGDVLVFLPGERDIMDLANFLKKSSLNGVEILPLYARLAGSEQQRIFAPHQGVRIVLSTNVAETSLTVPGIRYVIDSGLARISRYSPRTKVQRLPVEKISKASANQRKGRCGRVSEGVCVRLYSRDDFDSRSEFTDPEIQRTNLAAVILQMVALKLGSISAFPFIDPPDSRQVTDGMRLLEELGAVKDARGRDTQDLVLTKIGTMLSKLPCDPRLGRMVLEASKYGALNEVLIIASALAVMDPREYPADKKEASRQQHHRFDDEKSDFLAYLNLYRYIADLQKSESNSSLRRILKKEFISYLRVREWFDVLRQLRASCDTLKLRVNEKPAEYEGIHRSMLSGLLSHIGHFDDNDKGLYLGARGVKFLIHPSSGLGKRHPKWICCAELSETSRLFARTVAQIEPEWVETAAEHLISRSYAEPHWSKKQGAVIASMSIILYGLTLVSGRNVQYSSIDPKLCRELLIRDGLVPGDIEKSYSFLKHNLALVDEVVHEEDKLRRRDLLVESNVMESFYDLRIPQDIITIRHFDKWWREKQKSEPDFLNFRLEDITTGALEDREALFPEFWQQDRVRFHLNYVFDPSHKADGVNVQIPLAVLNLVKPREFEWQIPGLRLELFTALIKSLPKRLRRNLIPAPDFARALSEALGDDVSKPLYESAAAALTKMGGEIIEVDDFDRTLIPQHLTVGFEILDDKAKVIASGKNFSALKEQLGGKVQAALQQATKSHRVQKPSEEWHYGTIKREQISRRGSLEITAYPALTDRVNGVTLELYESRERQERAMWYGQRRLLQLGMKQPTSYLEAHLPNKAKLAMYYQPLGQVKDLVADITLAAIDMLMARQGRLCWDEQSFMELRDYVRSEINDASLEVAGVVEKILSRAHELKRLLKGRLSLEVARTYSDVSTQLDELVYKGFVSETAYESLKEIPRYLDAAIERIKKCARDVTRDLNCMRQISDTKDKYQSAVSRYPKDQVPAELVDLKWLFEELRVSLFAQQLGTKVPVSCKRIANEIDRIVREHVPQR